MVKDLIKKIVDQFSILNNELQFINKQLSTLNKKKREIKMERIKLDAQFIVLRDLDKNQIETDNKKFEVKKNEKENKLINAKLKRVDKLTKK